MDWCKKPKDITIQVIVSQLTISSSFPKGDIYVTICIRDISKITCSGKMLSKSQKIIWNHPFLFSGSFNTPVQIAIWSLPKEFIFEWNKQPLGDQIVTDIACLLKSGNTWECNVPGVSAGVAKISIICKETDIPIVTDGHDCQLALDKFAQNLYDFGKSKSIPYISTVIEAKLARLDLCPMEHATSVLSDIGALYFSLYQQDGKIAHLNNSIEVYQRRLDLCSLKHPECAEAFENLVMVLHSHYNIQKNKADLQKLIDMNKRWLTICPPGHLKHASALGSFATSLQKYYDIQGDITDLNKAIEMKEKRLELCPIGHPDHDTALNNLAVSLNSRYQKLGDITDLNQDIDLQEQSLRLCFPGHEFYGLSLQNLGFSTLDRYNKIKHHSDLKRANMLFKKALDTYSVHERGFAVNASQLAATTLLLSKATKESLEFPLTDEAFEVYRLLKKCGPAVSLELLQAVQAWTKDAEKHNHFSVLEGYQILFQTLDLFFSLNPSLYARYKSMQSIMKNISNINNAFSWGIRYNNFQMAIELFEKSRGILWNQLAHLDISMHLFKNQNHESHKLSKQFTILSADLKKYAYERVNQETNPYWKVKEEWQQVVNKIHGFNGPLQFLLPPCFNDLQYAAKYGPVIIINPSLYSCDALIVLFTHSPIHMSLHCSLDDIMKLYSQLSNLTHHFHAYGPYRELYVKEILYELWLCIVEPITTVLQNNVQLPPGSRIWWCPTSHCSFLPFHAAGPYTKGKKNFMDIYISSYTPSLSALLHIHNHLMHDISRASDVITFAAIGQSYISPTTILSKLPGVDHEIQIIQNRTNIPANVKFKAFTGPAASVEGAIQAFHDHHWVHIACHSKQYTKNPFDSGLMMNNGKLTLMHIIQECYADSEFAFLSTSNTATGDTLMPDEALHIAAGMLFSGFNGVIGALWSVNDTTIHHIVTGFYKEMFKCSNIDFKNAATALNTTMIKTINKVSLEERIGFVHIGV